MVVRKLENMQKTQIFSPTVSNGMQLQLDFNWLEEVIQTRIALHLEIESPYADIYDIPAPEVDVDASFYGNFVQHYNMTKVERLLFLLALAPHVKPQVLDPFFRPNRDLHRGYTEYGGIKGQLHNGFLPTGETALFLLAGDDLLGRLELEQLFDRSHYFANHNILKLENPPYQEPRHSGAILLSQEVIDLITRGHIRKPAFSRDFPAKLLTTSLDWKDLILNSQTMEQLKELFAWLKHESTLMDDWGMARNLKPGYKCLFYGPPGTGKTLTATLLGKEYQKDVYRIDLSTIVSKYIGETEKNLERIFEKVSYSDAILFFDEADALFGKRTAVNEAHDRYANQEVSYLLQRIEDYDGLIVLASNFKSNIDNAFLRRFQAVVHFPMPDAKERVRLWEKAFSTQSSLHEGVNLHSIASNHKLSGGSIINVVRYASLMTIQRGSSDIMLSDIQNGIRREFQKEGK